MNSRALSIAGVLLVVLVLALPVSATGPVNVLTVGPGQQYATIQAAVDAAKQGSRILVHPGSYDEAVSITTNNLQILAQGEGAVVTPPETPEHTAGFEVRADHVTIQGFEIRYGAGCAPGIDFEGSHNTFADNYIYLAASCLGVNALVCRDPDGGSDHNVVERNTIDQADLGIVIVAGTVDAINRGNVIRDNTLLRVAQDPIAVENGDGFLVSGNRIDGAPYGICIAVGTLNENKIPQGHHTIVNNTMSGCAENGISLYAWPGTVLAHNRIAENTIRDCTGDSLALEAGAGATLTNNQVISNTVGLSFANGILLAADAGAVVSNNLVQGNLVFHHQDGIYLTPGADHNRILNNEAQTNHEYGIAIAGDDNLIVGNWAWNNRLDIADTGEGNRWRNNTYTPSVGWAIGNDATGAPAIAHTGDGGRSWQRQGDFSAWSGASGNDISAVDDQTAWAAFGSGDVTEASGAILHTTDGGATWVAQTIPTGLAGGIKGVKGLSRNEAWAASLGGTVLHTTDGGVTWTVVPHDGVPIAQVNRIDASLGGDVWIAAPDSGSGDNPYMIHTPDDGSTWRQEPLPGIEAGHGPMSVNTNGMAVWSTLDQSGDLYRTLDRGEEWLKVATVGVGGADGDDICAAGMGAAWALLTPGYYAGTIWRVAVAPDGSVDSQEFQPASTSYSYEGVTCLDDRVAWVVGWNPLHEDDLPLGVVLWTIDGGEHWLQGSGPADIEFWKVSFVGAWR